MNNLADESLVAILLAVSVGYAVLRLGPRALRQKSLFAISRALGKMPGSFGLTSMVRRVEAASQPTAKGACGGCDNCGSESVPTVSAPVGNSEVKVPLSKIGRRTTP